jgi:hypothetical protein
MGLQLKNKLDREKHSSLFRWRRRNKSLYKIDTKCQSYQTFFPLSLATRVNKLEGSSLETLSSQVLEFEGKARANPIGATSDAPFLGELVELPANARLDWKVIARYKHSSLFGLVVSNEGNKFYKIDTKSTISDVGADANASSYSSPRSMSSSMVSSIRGFCGSGFGGGTHFRPRTVPATYGTASGTSGVLRAWKGHWKFEINLKHCLDPSTLRL